MNASARFSPFDVVQGSAPEWCFCFQDGSSVNIIKMIPMGMPETSLLGDSKSCQLLTITHPYCQLDTQTHHF